MSIRFSKDQIVDRIRFENSWWKTSKIDSYYMNMKRREYFKLFFPLIQKPDIRRAVVLMGPRRVGKTVLIFHAIQHLINTGVDPKKICYLSIETPIYNGIGLEELLHLLIEQTGVNNEQELYVFFDEIQYLKDWEVHLKTLVDSYHHIKFVVSGSAAAALKLKSNESGAGRFTDFILPPLTFNEYLSLKEYQTPDDFKELKLKLDHYIEIYNGPDGVKTSQHILQKDDIESLNNLFLDYINFGGYPEVSLSTEIQSNPGRYIRNDIIDKVLLRDLPSLYGIQDIQELNSLFTYIAYNTGNELSLDEISQNSGVAKNTIKRYLTYLEAAFLIQIVHRIDHSAKKFKRANFFKIYLTNPSLRSALFSPISRTDNFIGNMVETAIFSQWQHIENLSLHYARWNSGEVDIVYLGPTQKPVWTVEIKWSNRHSENQFELKNLKSFCSKHKLFGSLVTTIDIQKELASEGFKYEFVPASIYCYVVGRNIVENKKPVDQL